MKKAKIQFVGWAIMFCGTCVASAQPTTISYSGYLEHDGAPLTSTNDGIEMAFFLVRDNGLPVGDNQAQWNDQTEWHEIHPSVLVHQGNFSVELGSRTEFPSGLFSAQTFYFVGVKIRAENGWVEIGGPNARQKILASANAISAQEARDFTVRNDLRVNGHARIDGNARVSGDARVNAGMVVSGQESEGNGSYTFMVQTGDQRMRFDANEINTNTTLHLQNHTGNQTRVRGTLRVDNHADFDQDVNIDESLTVGTNQSVGRDLTVRRNQTVRGDLTVNGDITNLTVGGDSAEVHSAGRGNVNREIGRTGNRICFLTQVSITETDQGNEVGRCRVYTQNNRWYLQAHGNSDVNARCRARCLTW